MTSPSSSPAAGPAQATGGYLVSLRACLHAAILAGFFLGVLDGILIALGPGLPSGPLHALGCVFGGIATYIGAWAGLMVLLSPIVHLGFKHTPLGVRARHAFAMALAAGVFMELYWWSRPFVFYGRPATSPERMFSTLVMAIGSYALAILLARGFATRKQSTRFVVEGLAWVGLVLGVGYHMVSPSGPGQRGELNERNQDLPNVLLVVVDALRADVLGPYGNTEVQTPFIDELAARGVVFENAQAQAPFTWTSFGSILTGKYPRRHGLMKMKPGVRMAPNETLAWHLKQAVFAGEAEARKLEPDDFASGTFMTGTLSQGSGLMRGFDVYFEALVGHELVDTEQPWSVYRSDLLLFKFKNKLTQRFDSSLVVSTARDWLREHEGRRFMAMVHLYSTHTPYDPEPRFREPYVDPAYDGPIDRFDAYHRMAIEQGEFVPTAADVQQIRDLYYGGVSQADAAIGEVLEELRRAGALEDTLVILTSDHGESLGDDVLNGEALWEHNWMYETNLEVPLILSWPKGLPAGRRVSQVVETVDIVPTICDLMGLETPRDASDPERGYVDGHSLAPLARGEDFSGDRWDGYAFAENGQYMSIRDQDWKLVVARDGLGEEAWAASLEPEAPLLDRPRLFHLAEDPNEDFDLIHASPDQALRLLEQLRIWSDSMPVPISYVVKSARDLEHAANLEDLGYAEGVGMEDEAPE